MPVSINHLVFGLALVVAVSVSTTVFAQDLKDKQPDAGQEKASLSAGKTLEEGQKEAEQSALQARPTDVVMGQDQAGVTIVEYINIACPHCAATHKAIVDTLKTDYIDTGKVKLVFRELPMETAEFYVYMTAHCKGKGEFFNMLSLLVEEGQSWEGESAFITPLRAVAEKAGITKEAFYNCLENKDIENHILGNWREATEELGISRSPTVYVNGEILQDFSPASVRAAADAALK